MATKLTKIHNTLLRFVLRSKVVKPFLAIFLCYKLEWISARKSKKNTIRLLALNAHRYGPDLEELSHHPDVEIVALSPTIQGAVNALFLREIREICAADKLLFQSNSNPNVIRCRNALRDYLIGLIRLLSRVGRIDAIVSCSFFYAQDLDWASAARETQVPFVALHKENMHDPITHDATTIRYARNNFKFHGSKLIVFNKLARGLFADCNIASLDEIEIAGVLRLDTIYKRLPALRAPNQQITLFSFHHCVGLLEVENAEHYFSKDPNQGFVEYFDQVHGEVARYAHNHSDVEVWIKPKWTGSWIERIKEAIRKAGLEPDRIPNLHISIDRSAQDLIESSKVILGINSTTLLEAKLMGRSVIVPIWAEARNKYFDTNVYFHKYMQDVFEIVEERDGLAPKINELLNQHVTNGGLPADMIEDYLGFFDGKASQRIVDSIRKCVHSVST